MTASALPPKAESVAVDGQPDGWFPPRAWRLQVAPDGGTRLVVSLPSHELGSMHLALLRGMEGPLGVRYLRLTDRVKGQLPAPESYVRMDIDAGALIALIAARPALFCHDGRHQTWIRGKYGEQVVLDELGMLYCYPDDPSFRATLAAIPEADAVGMDTRDYVKVNFAVEADEQERTFLAEARLTPWK